VAGQDTDVISPIGSDWWDVIGVVVSIDDRFYLRTHTENSWRGEGILIDIHSGQVFEGTAPNQLWSFASWRIVLLATGRAEPTSLVTYSAPVLST
jgi:hypothetical protein